jgi:hypothetical protein
MSDKPGVHEVVGGPKGGAEMRFRLQNLQPWFSLYYKTQNPTINPQPYPKSYTLNRDQIFPLWHACKHYPIYTQPLEASGGSRLLQPQRMKYHLSQASWLASRGVHISRENKLLYGWPQPQTFGRKQLPGFWGYCCSQVPQPSPMRILFIDSHLYQYHSYSRLFCSMYTLL